VLVLTDSSANELYAAVCRQVLEHGRRVAPRGMPTMEVLGASLVLTNPRRRLVHLPPARMINPAFAVAEAVWILSGSNEPWIFRFNRALTWYADDGVLQGAYGPRIRRWREQVDQLDHVRRLLIRDPDSRQAVIQVYDPAKDTRGYRDVPCTVSYRFFLRDGRLQMHTTMRSNDVWLGLPYDLFTATLLHELMAGWLEVELGSYHHHVDSLHLYAKHAEGAARLAVLPVEPSPVMAALTAPHDRLTEFLTAVAAGAPLTGAGSAWRDFANVLLSYRGWTGGDRANARALAELVDRPLGEALRAWYDHLALATTTGGLR
jgi:thymidylate synthase